MVGRTPSTRIAGAALAILLVAGCTASEPAASTDSRAETIARLDRTTAGCGLPSGTLTLVGADEVRIGVRPDSDYNKVDCLLEALRRTEPRMKLLFIGNETYETGNRN